MYEVKFRKISPSHGGDYKSIAFWIITQCNLIEIYHQSIETAHSANRQHLYTHRNEISLES